MPKFEPLTDFSALEKFEAAYDRDNNEWWHQDLGDLQNLFNLLREDRNQWRDQVVAIRAQQRAALQRAEVAEAAVREAHTYCARPAGVCLPKEPLPR